MAGSRPWLAFKEIAGNPEINGYSRRALHTVRAVVRCEHRGWKMGLRRLGPESLPGLGRIPDRRRDQSLPADCRCDPAGYDASRNFFLAVHGDAAGAQPATYLAAMLDPQPTPPCRPGARRQATGGGRASGRVPLRLRASCTGIRKPLCIGASNEDAPRPDVWRSLLYPQLAGPFASRLIEEARPWACGRHSATSAEIASPCCTYPRPTSRTCQRRG